MKRFIALLLALIMTLSLCPVTALAQTTEGEAYEVTSHYVSEEDLGVTNEEAFAAYVQREFDEALGYEPPSFFRTAALEEGTLEKEIYDKLKVELGKIAAGERISTEITVYPIGTWSKEDLEVTSFVSDGNFTTETKVAIEGKLNLIVHCLLADCPLELYWYDKTVGINMVYSLRESGGGLKLGYVTFSFKVATDYDDPTDTKRLTTDASITGATSTAIDNAKAIVDLYKDAADLEKLAAYKDEICDLVSYDHEAADGMSTIDGINPWQMIHVFDGNADTNVVCEGYAKAFQYLCDLSTFTGDIECHTVTGTMSGGTGAGGHMWNVVTMDDGENYLVDVTNCDGGTIGAPDKLFMAHTTNSANNNQTHTFAISGTDIVFTYEESMADLFCDGYLAVSETAYGESAQEYVPLYWSDDGGASFHNGIDTPYEQPVNNDGRMAKLYVKDGETYTNINSETFNNDTITNLNEDIGFVGWSVNGDGEELFFWNTANAVEGAEGDIVFTIGQTQYLIKLKVRVSTTEEAAANFASIYLYDYTAQEYYTAATFDNAWNLCNGKLSFDTMSEERQAAVLSIVSNADDLLAAGKFIYWVLDGHKYNGQHFIEITDSTSDRDVAEFVGGYDLLWGDMTASGKTMVNDALAAIGGQYAVDELYEAANERINSLQARWFPAGTSGWEDRGPLTEAVAYANALEEGTAYIELLSDVKTNAPLVFNEGTKTFLDLNGYTIDRGLTEAVENGNVITVYGDLILRDTSSDDVTEQGKVTGGYNSANGGGVRVIDGTFTMSGSYICGNVSAYGGGGVCVEGGTFTMTGGEITDNTAMFGGGVCGSMNISGAPVVTGNTSGVNDSEQTNNVYLFSGKTITVIGALSADASIGVSTGTHPSAGNPVIVATGTDDYELRAGDGEAFFSDAGYLSVHDIGNNAVLLKDATVVATLLGGPDVAATGEKVTLTLHIAGTGIRGVEAALNYDPAVLELVSVKSLLDGWEFKQNKTNYLLYHEEESFDEADVLQVTLQVKSGFEGAETTVSFTEIEASDGSNDFETSDAAWGGQVKSTALDTTTGSLNLFDDSVLSGQLTCNYQIYDAKFANEELNEVFDIAVFEDGTFEVVPEAGKPADKTWAQWGKAMAKTYKSAVMVRYDVADDCWSTTEKELTIKLTAVAPKVTAKAVKFNSFYMNPTQEMAEFLTLPAGTALKAIKVDESKTTEKVPACPAWLTLNEESETGVVTLMNDELTGNKASGKLNLEVWLEGYRAPAQVAVSVSAAYTAPKLKVSLSSVSLVSNAMYQNPVELTLLSGDSKVAFTDIDVTDIRVAEVFSDEKEAKTYAASKYIVIERDENFSENGTFTVTTQNVDGVVEGGKVALIVTIGENENQTVIVPLTTRVTVPTLKASTTKVTLNTAMHNSDRGLCDQQTVTLSTNVESVWFDDGNSGNVTWEIRDAKGNPCDSGNLTVTNVGGELTIATNSAADSNYKIRVTVAGAAKPVDISVTAKATLPKLKLSKTSITLNTAMGDYADVQTVEVTDSDVNYDFVLQPNEIKVPENSGLSAVVGEGNVISLSAAATTASGSYKVEIDHKMPGGQPVKSTLTVKVVEKLPTVKFSTKSVSLFKGAATIDVSGLEGYDVGDLVVTGDIAYVSVEGNSETLTVALAGDYTVGKTYKVNVAYELADGALVTKPIAISVKAVDKITATATVKGNMDITRPGATSSNFTFKYTGWYPGEYGEDGPCLQWAVYATNGKIPVTSIAEGNTEGLIAYGSAYSDAQKNYSEGWFKNVSVNPYGVTLALDTSGDGAWVGGEVNPKYTYTVKFALVFPAGDPLDMTDDDVCEFLKPVKMTVKQSSAKFTVQPNAVTLSKTDGVIEPATFTISGTGNDAMNVAKIAKVDFVDSALVEQLAVDYQVNEDKTCNCTLAWEGNVPVTAKSGTVKVNIWLVGNQNNTKPNATVSVKVNVK